MGSAYAYTPASQPLANVSGSLTRTYGYDANGSVTTDGRGFTYVYDVRGELARQPRRISGWLAVCAARP